MNINPSTPAWVYPADVAFSDQVNSVAVSDSGSRCVFGTWNEEGSGTFAIFLLDQTGKCLWKRPISEQLVNGGVYWTDISGTGDYLAAGGEISKTEGFLRAYFPDRNLELLNISTGSRVNQVSLSRDGRYLVACHGNTVTFYRLNPFIMQYEQISEQSLVSDQEQAWDIISCVISDDGSTVVASGIIYDGNGGTTGLVQAFYVSENKVYKQAGCILKSTGCMRVAVVDSGEYWAASFHDGSCALFHRNQPDRFLWKYLPDDDKISLAYAVAVTETASGQVFVACGANTNHPDHQGLLYLVENRQNQAEFKWSAEIALGVNPGVSMDREARWVTATDGEPDKDHSLESAGSFYLFHGSGEEAWQFPTALMNWPMALTKDGSMAVGGSDGGMVYGWLLDNG